MPYGIPRVVFDVDSYHYVPPGGLLRRSAREGSCRQSKKIVEDAAPNRSESIKTSPCCHDLAWKEHCQEICPNISLKI